MTCPALTSTARRTRYPITLFTKSNSCRPAGAMIGPSVLDPITRSPSRTAISIGAVIRNPPVRTTAAGGATDLISGSLGSTAAVVTTIGAGGGDGDGAGSIGARSVRGGGETTALVSTTTGVAARDSSSRPMTIASASATTHRATVAVRMTRRGTPHNRRGAIPHSADPAG